MASQFKCDRCSKDFVLSGDIGRRRLFCPDCGSFMKAVGQPSSEQHVDSSSAPVFAAICGGCKSLIDLPESAVGQRTLCPKCQTPLLTSPKPLPPPTPRTKVPATANPKPAIQPPPFPGAGGKATSVQNGAPGGAPKPPNPASTSATAKAVSPPGMTKAASFVGPTFDIPPDGFVRPPSRPGVQPPPGPASAAPSSRVPSSSGPPPFVRPPNAPNSSSAGAARRSGWSNPPPPPEANKVQAPPQVDELRSVKLWKSWRNDKLKLPHYLVKGRGKLLEAILTRFVAAIYREGLPGVEIVIAGELTNIKSVNRPLRIISSVGKAHMGVTDVLFRAEGNDLYVKFQSNPRTWITFLKLGMYAICFLAVYVLLMILYLFGTGAFDGWATDFAQKHARKNYAGEDVSPFYANAITHGSYAFDNVKFVQLISSGNGLTLWKQYVASLQKWLNESLANEKQDNSESGFKAMARMGSTLQASGMIMLADLRGPDYLAIAVADFLAQEDASYHFIWYQSGTGQLRDIFRIEYTNQVNLRDRITGMVTEPKEFASLVSSSFDRCVEYRPAWTVFRLFFADPKVAMLSIGAPSAIMAMLVGAGLFFLPSSVLSVPCRFLGWPTPDEFNNMVQARNAWAERVLSDTLLHEFGVQEGDRFNIMSQ
jgi:DNA-directed RNA polymerase subunit RPC12/RpoP